MKDCKHKSVLVLGRGLVKCQWCDKEMEHTDYLKERAVEKQVLEEEKKGV